MSCSPSQKEVHCLTDRNMLSWTSTHHMHQQILLVKCKLFATTLTALPSSWKLHYLLLGYYNSDWPIFLFPLWSPHSIFTTLELKRNCPAIWLHPPCKNLKSLQCPLSIYLYYFLTSEPSSLTFSSPKTFCSFNNPGVFLFHSYCTYYLLCLNGQKAVINLTLSFMSLKSSNYTRTIEGNRSGNKWQKVHITICDTG